MQLAFLCAISYAVQLNFFAVQLTSARWIPTVTIWEQLLRNGPWVEWTTQWNVTIFHFYLNIQMVSFFFPCFRSI